MSRKYTVITKGDMRIGYTLNTPYRKRPYLLIGIGNKNYCLAPFSSEEKAEFFFDNLCNMIGVENDKSQATNEEVEK